jgi:hypothetical protein
MKRSLLFVALGSLVIAAGFGCSDSDPITGSDGEEGTHDDDGGGDGEGASGAGDATGGGGSDPGPAVCPDATDVLPVEPAASNLLFLLDRSGSMHLRVTDTETRWTLTTAGLSNILSSLSSDTVAGLAMFPSGDQPVTCCEITAGNFVDCTCAAGELPDTASRCDETTYQSLAVSMEPLTPSHASEITGSVAQSDTEFYWGTPLAPALGGTLDAASSLGLDGVTSVVLLTDGLPTSCETTADPAANDIARALDAAALGAANGVRTYVVGIDAEAASSDPATDLAVNLSQLASAGGTASYPGCDATSDCAYRVNVDNFEQALAEALESIALEAASCTFELPMPNGGEPDYGAVNITVTSGGDTEAISRDTSHANGWDYLPGNDKFRLYGEACEMMKADANAKVEVVVGCTTI